MHSATSLECEVLDKRELIRRAVASEGKPCLYIAALRGTLNVPIKNLLVDTTIDVDKADRASKAIINTGMAMLYMPDLGDLSKVAERINQSLTEQEQELYLCIYDQTGTPVAENIAIQIEAEDPNERST